MKTIKNRFGKVLVVTTLAVSLLATSFAFAGTTKAAAAAEGTAVMAKASSTVISWSKAKAIFKDELPSSAAIKYLRLTRDDGMRVYKGKAVKGSYVYSIELDAYTGEVLDSDRDYEGSRYSASRVGAVSKTTIKNKVLRKIPNAYIIYIKLTRDDGRYVYEGEAYKNGYEYDFEYTKGGSLIEWERDKV